MHLPISLSICLAVSLSSVRLYLPPSLSLSLSLFLSLSLSLSVSLSLSLSLSIYTRIIHAQAPNVSAYKLLCDTRGNSIYYEISTCRRLLLACSDPKTAFMPWSNKVVKQVLKGVTGLGGLRAHYYVGSLDCCKVTVP